MAKTKPTFLRRWYYETFFSGSRHIDVPLDMQERSVRKEVERMWSGGNWIQNSLKRGKKVKKR